MKAMTYKMVTTTIKYICLDAERVQQAVNQLPFGKQKNAASDIKQLD